MPYTNQPETNEQDAVMALVGDTNVSDQLLTDAQYTMILASEVHPYSRASLACTMLASKWAPKMTHRIGDLWREAKVVYQHYKDQAQWFRLEGQRRLGFRPFAGGTNADDVDTRQSDTTQVQPSFAVGMQDASGLVVDEDDE